MHRRTRAQRTQERWTEEEQIIIRMSDDVEHRTRDRAPVGVDDPVAVVARLRTTTGRETVPDGEPPEVVPGRRTSGRRTSGCRTAGRPAWPRASGPV